MCNSIIISKICRQIFHQRKEVYIMAETKEIISRFYDLHEKPSIIAKELNIRPSYVTKVIQKDDRYIPEKEYRTKISKENRKNPNVNGLETNETTINNLKNK